MFGCSSVYVLLVFLVLDVPAELQQGFNTVFFSHLYTVVVMFCCYCILRCIVLLSKTILLASVSDCSHNLLI